MKKLFIVGLMLLFVVGGSVHADEWNKKNDEIKKLEAQQQTLSQQRAQHIETVKKIEIEIIKIQAVIDYLKKQKKVKVKK